MADLMTNQFWNLDFFKLPTFSSNSRKNEIEHCMAYGNTQIQTLAEQYYCEGDGTLLSDK